MPHDINGTRLKVGDSIVVEGTIKDIQLGEEYCNITMVTDEPMFPSDQPTVVVLNAKQVTLCRRATLLEEKGDS